MYIIDSLYYYKRHRFKSSRIIKSRRYNPRDRGRKRHADKMNMPLPSAVSLLMTIITRSDRPFGTSGVGSEADIDGPLRTQFSFVNTRPVARFRRAHAQPLLVRLARRGRGADHRLQQAPRHQPHDRRGPLVRHAPQPGRGHPAPLRRGGHAEGGAGALDHGLITGYREWRCPP